MPAILNNDETVLTPGQMRALGNGNGGGIALTYAPRIDARGADVGVLPRIMKEIDRSKKEAVAMMTDQIQRGGGMASVVGRRR